MEKNSSSTIVFLHGVYLGVVLSGLADALGILIAKAVIRYKDVCELRKNMEKED